jgi:hypothetical protein
MVFDLEGRTVTTGESLVIFGTSIVSVVALVLRVIHQRLEPFPPTLIASVLLVSIPPTIMKLG